MSLASTETVGIEQWTTVGAARRFEEAARKAEKQGNHRLAAALYRAALLMLHGRPPDDEVDEGLADAGCIAPARGEPPRNGELPRAPGASSSSNGHEPGA